ncbi:MAG: hypothetical protein JWN04_6653 [Myxococcaceae bacterium]|nr:hypothetical protein [Myxococcaceae bacterium]
MPELASYALSAAAGTLFGAMFFGGLWWTVQRSLRSQCPALWFVSSLLLRTSITLAGFYLISGGQLGRLLCCLLGFVLARPLVTWWTRPARANSPASLHETTHAP